MNIFSWILFGLIVGVVGGAIDDTKGGLLNYLLLGVGGALLGGIVANMLFNNTFSGFNVTAFLIASFGAIALLFVGRAIRKI